MVMYDVAHIKGRVGNCLLRGQGDERSTRGCPEEKESKRGRIRFMFTRKVFFGKHMSKKHCLVELLGKKKEKPGCPFKKEKRKFL